MEGLTIIILVVAAIVWGVVEYYGKMQERKKNAEKTSEDMVEDASIAVKPGVDDPASVFKAYQVTKSSRIMTMNEIREIENLNPIEGGDVLLDVTQNMAQPWHLPLFGE